MFTKLNSSGLLAKRALSSAAGRMLVGYLLFRMFTLGRVEAAPTGPANTTGLCTAEALLDFLEKSGTVTNDDLELAYEHCRGEFLDENKINPSVKETVDKWVGVDLSKAETNQIFLAYELALVGPKPERLPETFERDCRQMVDKFQTFRDSLEPLMSRVDIDLNSLIADGGDEVEAEERELLNYVQYSQFCKSLLKHTNMSANDNQS